MWTKIGPVAVVIVLEVVVVLEVVSVVGIRGILAVAVSIGDFVGLVRNVCEVQRGFLYPRAELVQLALEMVVSKDWDFGIRGYQLTWWAQM